MILRTEREQELERMKKRRAKQAEDDAKKAAAMELFPDAWPWPKYLHGGGLYSDVNCKYETPSSYSYTDKTVEPWTIDRALELFLQTGCVQIVKGHDGCFTTFGPPDAIGEKYKEHVVLEGPLFKIDPPLNVDGAGFGSRAEGGLKVEWWAPLGDLVINIAVEINKPHGCIWVDPSPDPDHPRRKRVLTNYQLIIPDRLKELEVTKYAGAPGSPGHRVLWSRA